MSDVGREDKDRRESEDTAPTAEYSGPLKGPGSRVGQFTIERELGRGGMGVVYLAQDTKLDRSVAVKSLPPEIMDNPQVRSRLQREAKLLASLNHPNIATIHDVIEQDTGAGFLVLEYVPGETLGERIRRGRMKVEEALSIAKQVAEAMAAAHEQGVIHRDLKPGNIKITPKGRVKVLDFGLAKVVGGEGVDQQTTITEPGKVMGTPAYMSPEQARGKPTDQRSDVWSFGCVLYEMLSGRVPFQGETVSDTLAHILDRGPNWQGLPEDTPENIRVLLRRCLEKDVHQRLQHIGDARIEIADALGSPTSGSPPTSGPFATVKPRRVTMLVGAIAIIFVAAIAAMVLRDTQGPPSPKEIRLVVLPFENLGSEEDEYFVTGMTEAITSRLAGIGGLGVISPRTAEQYKDSEQSTQEISKELNVAYVLEGIVQRERRSDPNSRVRIMPRLIRASDDSLLLAPVYNEDMNEIFALQADVAERVAKELDLKLLEPERRAMAYKPTENMEAYDYYLRGLDYCRRSFLESDLTIGIEMLEKATLLDRTFALAHAELSIVHSAMYFHNHDRSKQRPAMAEAAAREALHLDPELPEAHLAMGFYYYHCKTDYVSALDQFTIAQRSTPNDGDVLSGIAWVKRRQGHFEESVKIMEETLELDPRSARINYVIGETNLLMRNYEEAERHLDRAVSLAPDWARPYAWKAQLYLTWEGDRDKAGKIFELALNRADSSEDHFYHLWSIRLSIFDKDYDEALKKLSEWHLDVFDTQFFFIPKALLSAQIHGLKGDRQLEREHYEAARKLLDTKIAESDEEDPQFHSSLGIALAGLGDAEGARREGELAVKLLPVSKEAYKGTFHLEDVARIYVMIGEYDLAAETIEKLLDIPAELSVSLLRIDPAWEPLNGHERIKRFLEKEQ